MVERRRRNSSLAEQVEVSAEKKIERKAPIDTSILIPSGSTMLNCACSDNPFGAFVLGKIVTLPGGSVGGKTMLALTMLAECTADLRFDNYDLIYDDGEEALGIDIPYLFENLEHRIKPPARDDNGESIPSATIQDFKGHILKRCKKASKPFIYILDSLDALSTDEELEKEYKIAIAKAQSAEAVKELKGSYKTEKAKHLGEALRMIKGDLKKTKSALFIIQQVRANVGVVFGKKTTTSGGLAPFYYSFHQVWMTKTGSVPRTVGGISYKIGSSTLAEVTKNKLNGKRREVEFDIYDDYGIDDITSCINFLIKAEHWKKDEKAIVAHDLDLKGSKNELVKAIEKEKLKKELQKIIGQVWNKIEDSLLLNRKRRFE